MELKNFIQKTVELMGFEDFSVSHDEAGNQFSVLINDKAISEKNLPFFVNDLECLARLIAQKNNFGMFFIDVNNYRKKRRELIVELAKATARKALAEQKEIPLPPMNSFERRIVHLELSSRPDLKTESVGDGKGRCIIIKPITDN